MKIFRQRGELVIEAMRGKVALERGDIQQLVGQKNIALIAQYSQSRQQSRSLSQYLRELKKGGFFPVVISTCSEGPLEFPHGIPDEIIILQRPNVGYDFGSWATALGVLPGVREADTVLLTNDSLLGPFSSIQHLLEWIKKPGADICAMTSSFQFVRHLQSFFLAFRGGILADQPWRDFFDGIRQQGDKYDVVTKYELGVSRTAFANAYSTEEWVSSSELGVPYGNPTVDAWKKLIESDVPFLKRTIMTHPSTEEEAVEAAMYIQRKYRTDIKEW